MKNEVFFRGSEMKDVVSFPVCRHAPGYFFRGAGQRLSQPLLQQAQNRPDLFRHGCNIVLNCLTLAQDFVHSPALRQLVDQLVELPDLLHERVFDIFYANTADTALDEGTVRVHSGRLSEKCPVVDAPLKLDFEGILTVAGEPSRHGVHLLARQAFALCLSYKHRINVRKFHRKNFFVFHV